MHTLDFEVYAALFDDEYTRKLYYKIVELDYMFISTMWHESLAMCQTTRRFSHKFPFNCQSPQHREWRRLLCINWLIKCLYILDVAVSTSHSFWNFWFIFNAFPFLLSACAFQRRDLSIAYRHPHTAIIPTTQSLLVSAMNLSLFIFAAKCRHIKCIIVHVMTGCIPFICNMPYHMNSFVHNNNKRAEGNAQSHT